MKSIEEKARTYDEAIEALRSLFAEQAIKHCDRVNIKDISNIFSELKESEDERIRKELIKIVNDHYSLFKEIDRKKTIVWLEKQGEQKPMTIQIGKSYKCIGSPRYTCFQTGFVYRPCDEFLCGLMNFCSDCFEPIEEDEQKPIDKVEPKFKVGDWIVYNHNPNLSPKKIIQITNQHYVFADCSFEIKTLETDWHLWTIQDAKDGDVLACENGWTCIFKTLVNDETFSSYCFMDKTKWFCETGCECHTLKEEFVKVYNGKIYPATKEQRNQLEKAMTDAGYTFDFEKKELKKIEQKPAEWSEEDEYQVNTILHGLDLKRELYKKEGNKVEEERYNTQYNWLKSLKERIQLKQEWSEEDESHIRYLIECLEVCVKGTAIKMTPSTAQKYINWLKSLRPQSTWKPSVEQLEALEEECMAHSNYHLCRLYEQLKKL